MMQKADPVLRTRDQRRLKGVFFFFFNSLRQTTESLVKTENKAVWFRPNGLI